MAAQEQESVYADSVCSSPRSVVGQRSSHDEEPRVRFMCSYGGRILPRPHDNALRYVGGDTRIVALSRTLTFSLLISKLSKLCGSNVTVKYQLPNEDLDALISVTTDEDLDNMMDEYDRLNSADNQSSRLRLFLFPAKLENASSLGSLLEGSKREHWFLDALNGVPVLTRRRSEVSSMASEVPDYLFGLDTVEDWDREENKPGPGKSRLKSQNVAELRSAPASPPPMSPPYGSTSSAPPSIDAHTIAELAAKAEKLALHPAVIENQATKLGFKPDPEKNSHHSPEAAMAHESPERVSEDVRVNALHAEENYKQAFSIVQQPPSDQYVEYRQGIPSNFVPQGQSQAAAYWQMQEDCAGQLYYVAPPMPQTIQRQPSYVPVQRMPATVAYGAEQRMPLHATVAYGADQGMPLPATVAYGADQGVPVQKLAKPAGKAPLYRSSTPRPVPSMMMMRPPVLAPSSDQYAYQQQVGYEGVAAQQVYYTQKPTVMNSQYHQPMRAPFPVDVQISPETVSEGNA